MKSHVFGFALLSVTAVVASAPAHAQNGTLTRSFVSSAGSDSNPCTVTQPCATFAQAYTAVAANGIVAALDPGKYGPLTITGPVTINGNGWAAVTATAQGNGFTVNAVSGNVTLTGLEIDGAGAAYNGIVFNSGSSLTVTNCVVQNMVQEVGRGPNPNTGNGILLAPTSGTIDIAITNATVANNGNIGLYLPPSGAPTVNAIFDRVTANANKDGIYIDSSNASGGTTSITLTNSIASNNSIAGIFANGGPAVQDVLIDNVNASSNGDGIYVNASANVVLGRSVVANNAQYGIFNGTSTFYTYQNNEIYLNGNSNAVGGGNSLTNATYQ
jgi:Right handed beta helix region